MPLNKEKQMGIVISFVRERKTPPSDYAPGLMRLE